MKLTDTQMIEIAQHAFTRMDGAWFLALAKKFGIQTAWEMDVEAWKQLFLCFWQEPSEELSSRSRLAGEFFGCF